MKRKSILALLVVLLLAVFPLYAFAAQGTPHLYSFSKFENNAAVPQPATQNPEPGYIVKEYAANPQNANSTEGVLEAFGTALMDSYLNNPYFVLYVALFLAVVALVIFLIIYGNYKKKNRVKQNSRSHSTQEKDISKGFSYENKKPAHSNTVIPSTPDTPSSGMLEHTSAHRTLNNQTEEESIVMPESTECSKTTTLSPETSTDKNVSDDPKPEIDLADFPLFSAGPIIAPMHQNKPIQKAKESVASEPDLTETITLIEETVEVSVVDLETATSSSVLNESMFISSETFEMSLPSNADLPLFTAGPIIPPLKMQSTDGNIAPYAKSHSDVPKVNIHSDKPFAGVRDPQFEADISKYTRQPNSYVNDVSKNTRLGLASNDFITVEPPAEKTVANKTQKTVGSRSTRYKRKKK